MGDWADTRAKQFVMEHADECAWHPDIDPNSRRILILIDDLAAALRDAAAEARAQAIERSAELIGRQVEPRDA